MVKIIEISVPILLILVAAIIKFILDMRRPSPIAVGCIIPKVCVVSSEEVLQYRQKAEEEERSAAKHLRREVRRKQIGVYWIFLREMSLNTYLFLRAVLFEKSKIDQTKSSLDYEQRETLILELVDETLDLRWELMKEQVALLRCALLGGEIDHKGLVSLLGAYKQLEQDFIALVGMGEESCYRDMLIERLGLTNWRIFNGGSGPEPA